MQRSGSASRRAVLRIPAALWLLLAVVGGVVLVGAGPAGATEPDRATEQEDGTGATIAGVVVGADGRRHLGVIVQLHDGAAGSSDAGRTEGGRAPQPAYTGVDGRYRFEDLAPGCYRISVRAPAGTSFADAATTHDQEVCVEAGQAITDLRSVAVADRADPTANSVVEIVHVGHHLGQLEPTTMTLEVAGTTVEAEIGGWPRVVAAIEAARPVDAPESTITVDTGGVLAGSALAHLFAGAADAALLNRACFDYLAPSPEDRARADELATFVHFLDDEHCRTTVLDPDLLSVDDPPSGDPAVALHPVGDDTVAIVALAPGVDDETDAVAATIRRIEELTQDGPSTIVVLSGFGLAADRELAARLPAIDAIVGSGPDSLLGDVADLGLADAGPYPDRARNADGDPVCLGHAGARSIAVGVLRIELDDQGRVVTCGGRLEILVGRLAVVERSSPDAGPDDASGTTDGVRPSPAQLERAVAEHPALAATTPDRATARALDRWRAVLEVLLDDPVATVTDERCRTRVPGRSVGLLCGTDGRVADTTAPRADAQQLVAEALRHRITDLEPGAIALVDSDTVDGAIHTGPLSAVEAYRLLPTGPTLLIVELRGDELLAVLRERVQAALSGSPGAYPHASGLRFTPDLSRSGRPSIGPVEVLDQGGLWQPVDPAARYRVVVTDRLAADDAGSPTLARAAADGRAVRTTIGTAEALLDYIDDGLDGVVDGALPEPVGDPGTEPTDQS